MAERTGDNVVGLFGREPSRVRELGSDRVAELLTGRAGHRPSDGTVRCRDCGTTARLDTTEVCLWWPFGCSTRDSEPHPRLCWRCCGEHERLDLVDAGCHQAETRVRYGEP